MTDAKNEIAQAKANAALKAAETPQDYSDYVTDPAPCTFVEMLEGAQENMALEKVGRLATQLPADLAGLVERLRTACDDDHERGCQMRYAECSCGFDEASARTAGEAADTITALSRQLAEREAEIATLGRAVLATVAATRAYLPPDGIGAKECLSRILGATDNPTINPLIAALENGHG